MCLPGRVDLSARCVDIYDWHCRDSCLAVFGDSNIETNPYRTIETTAYFRAVGQINSQVRPAPIWGPNVSCVFVVTFDVCC